MENAIATTKRQKLNKYNELVDVLCRKFPNSDVRFRAMVVGVMGMISASIKQVFRKIQPQAQTSWVIHQIIQAIGNHNHKLWIVRDQCTIGAGIFQMRRHERGSRNADGSDGNTSSNVRTSCSAKNAIYNREKLRRNDLNNRTGRKLIDITTKY